VLSTAGKRGGQGHPVYCLNIWSVDAKESIFLVYSSHESQRRRTYGIISSRQGCSQVDVLTDVLESIHVRSLITGRLELTAPWGLSVAGGRPGFLVVTRGTCWLDVEGLPESIQLAGGDFVLLPKAPTHVLRDSRTSDALPLDEVLCGSASARGCRPGGIFQHGGGGAMTTLVGGCFQIDAADHNPLLSALPPIIHVKGDHGSPVQWLEMTLQFVAVRPGCSRAPGGQR
jgi:hypothetical protein